MPLLEDKTLLIYTINRRIDKEEWLGGMISLLCTCMVCCGGFWRSFESMDTPSIGGVQYLRGIDRYSAKLYVTPYDPLSGRYSPWTKLSIEM